MIRDVHPGSESCFFLPIPDLRSRGQKSTGSRIRIRNTEPVPALLFNSVIGTIYVRRKDARESSGSEDSLPVQKNKGNRNRILDSDEENKEEEGEEDEVDEDDEDEDEEDEDYQEDNGKISTFLNGTARVRSVSFTRAALMAKSCRLLSV
jgi:hypothetical protein